MLILPCAIVESILFLSQSRDLGIRLQNFRSFPPIDRSDYSAILIASSHVLGYHRWPKQIVVIHRCMIVSHFECNTTFLKPSIINHALSCQEHYTDFCRSSRICKNLYNVLGKTMSWLFIDGFRNVEICVQNAKQSHTYLQHSTIELRVWMTTICLVSGGCQGHEIIKLLL